MNLKELNEKYEETRDAALALVTRSEAINDKGEATGFTDEELRKFDDLNAEKNKLIRMIDVAKKAQEMRNEEALSRASAPAVHTTKRVFSLTNAIRAAAKGDWSDAGLERETMQEKANSGGKAWNERMIILDPNMDMRANAVSVSGIPGDGGNLVETQYRPEKLVDQLWSESIFNGLPVIRNTGLKGNQSVPTITSKTTATMVGEVAALPDKQKITTGILTATPKEMVTSGAFSRMLDLQSEPAIRNIFQNQILRAITEKLSEMFITGGASPLLPGILSLTTGGGVGQTTTLVGATNGKALTYKDIVGMTVELAKKLVGGNLNFLTNAQVTGALMTTLKDAANTNSGYIMLDGQRTLLGYPVSQNQIVPSNLTKGTATGNCSAFILGNFSETEVFQWGNIAVEFDPYTMADLSQVVVRSYSFWDFMHKRPENYVIARDVLTT